MVSNDGRTYYRHVLAALELLVTEKGLAARKTLAGRKDAWAEAYRNTPYGQPVVLARKSGS